MWVKGNVLLWVLLALNFVFFVLYELFAYHVIDHEIVRSHVFAVLLLVLQCWVYVGIILASDLPGRGGRWRRAIYLLAGPVTLLWQLHSNRVVIALSVLLAAVFFVAANLVVGHSFWTRMTLFMASYFLTVALYGLVKVGLKYELVRVADLAEEAEEMNWKYMLFAPWHGLMHGNRWTQAYWVHHITLAFEANAQRLEARLVPTAIADLQKRVGAWKTVQ